MGVARRPAAGLARDWWGPVGAAPQRPCRAPLGAGAHPKRLCVAATPHDSMHVCAWAPIGNAFRFKTGVTLSTFGCYIPKEHASYSCFVPPHIAVVSTPSRASVASFVRRRRGGGTAYGVAEKHGVAEHRQSAFYEQRKEQSGGAAQGVCMANASGTGWRALTGGGLFNP